MVEAMLLFFALLLRAFRGRVRAKVRSVPRTVEEANRLAEELYPLVVEARQVAYRQQAIEIRRHMQSVYGVKVKPAPPRGFSVRPVSDAVLRAAGITGGWSGEVDTDYVEDVDGVLAKPFAPAGREDAPDSVEEFTRRVSSALERHVQNAGREAVIDTAVGPPVPRQELEIEDVVPDPVETDEGWEEFEDVPTIEDYKREREEARRRRQAQNRPKGVVLGWARVLAGETNCAFCAMLASRGPVYKSGVTAGFEAHDGCDCSATLVVKNQPWEGEAEWRALEELWRDARDNPSEYELRRAEFGQLDSPMKRFRSRFTALDREFKDEAFKAPMVREVEGILVRRGLWKERRGAA